jgi:hypothetical protein
VSDRHHEYDEAVVLDGGNYSIVINPVAPKPFEVSG